MVSRLVLAGALSSVVAVFPASSPIARILRVDRARSHHTLASTNRLSEAEEVALAITAAPASITASAAVYAWHDGQFTKARDGSSGWACMVARDARANGVYPMCFDPEGARTLMAVEMFRTQLRARGLSNTAIEREVDAGYQTGKLQHPAKPALRYMMSSHQVLTASKGDETRVIGAWHPHVMIYLPGASADQFSLGKQQDGPVSMPFSDGAGAEMVVEVPHWADNPSMSDQANAHTDATGKM